MLDVDWHVVGWVGYGMRMTAIAEGDAGLPGARQCEPLSGPLPSESQAELMNGPCRTDGS